MRKIIFFILLVIYQPGFAQKLAGNWYSTDSTRVYEIKQVSATGYAVLVKLSERKSDSLGFIAIRELEYNARKKRYEGFIYTPDDNTPVFVKIRFRKNDGNRIRLTLNRMFFFTVAMDWTRVPETALN